MYKTPKSRPFVGPDALTCSRGTLRHFVRLPRCLCAFLLGLCLWVPTDALAANCIALFNNGQLLQAASCFLKKANQLKPLSQLSLTQRYTKGRYLKNAAAALGAAAKRSGVPLYQAYLREHALTILQEYLDKKLHENQQRLLQVQQQKKRLLQQIKFASLTILTGRPRARACLVGYKYKKCHRGAQIRLKLRPGRYNFTMQTSDGPKSQQLNLAPWSKKTLNFQPAGTLVAIQASPEGSKIYVDGIIQGRAPLRFKISTGQHVIKVVKRCYEPQSRTLQLVPGKPQSLQFRLKPMASSSGHRSGRLLGLTAIIGGGALVVFGMIAQGISASSYFESQKLKEEYMTLPKGTPSSVWDKAQEDIGAAVASANIWQSVAIGGYALGATGVVLGILKLKSLPPAPKQACP